MGVGKFVEVAFVNEICAFSVPGMVDWHTCAISSWQPARGSVAGYPDGRSKQAQGLPAETLADLAQTGLQGAHAPAAHPRVRGQAVQNISAIYVVLRIERREV